jgi:cytochrome c-type biogenesis protein CcmH
VIARSLAVVVAALALAGPAAAAACTHPKTSLAYLEGQVMCPVCHTTLDQSDSAAARQIESHIAVRISQCWTARQIENELVANYGPSILAYPPHRGFDLVAWWLPIAGVLGGALVLAFGVWRWSHSREAEPEPAAAGSGIDEETEQRLDDLLARFD